MLGLFLALSENLAKPEMEKEEEESSWIWKDVAI